MLRQDACNDFCNRYVRILNERIAYIRAFKNVRIIRKAR